MLQFFILGTLCAFIVCMFSESPFLMWRFGEAFIISNGVFYISLVVAIFAESPISLPHGPENAFAVFVLLPARGILLTYVVVQPLLVLGIAGGLLAATLLAGVTKLGSVNPLRGRCTTSEKVVNRSFRRYSFLASLVIVTFGFSAMSLRVAHPDAPIPMRLEVQHGFPNLSTLQMTSYSSSHVASFVEPDLRPGQAKHSMEGKCGLTSESAEWLRKAFQWQVLTDSDSRDVRWIVEGGQQLLISTDFDKTFAANPRYKSGTAFLDPNAKVLYFSAYYVGSASSLH